MMIKKQLVPVSKFTDFIAAQKKSVQEMIWESEAI